MSRIPETTEGLSETDAVQAGTILRQGWDVLRSLQFNKTASIVRYVVTDPEIEQARKASLGVEPARTLVSGLADLPVFVSPVSIREVGASYGALELSDVRFVFWDHEVKMTDMVRYDGKDYKVIQVVNWDVDVGICQIIGRAV